VTNHYVHLRGQGRNEAAGLFALVREGMGVLLAPRVRRAGNNRKAKRARARPCKRTNGMLKSASEYAPQSHCGDCIDAAVLWLRDWRKDVSAPSRHDQSRGRQRARQAGRVQGDRRI